METNGTGPVVDRRYGKKLGGPGGMVRVYKETWDRLKGYCQRTGAKVGEVVDEAIQMFLGEKDEKGGR